MASKQQRRAKVTEADVQKQARSMGLEWDVHGDHDWAHITVFLDMVEQGLIPDVCVAGRTLTDQAGKQRVGEHTAGEYHAHVVQIAHELVEQHYDAEEDELADDLSDHIHAAVDGDHYVIYHHANLACLVFSENWLAIDEGVDDGAASFDARSLTEVLQRAAFFALEADVRDAIDRIVADRRAEGSE